MIGGSRCLNNSPSPISLKSYILNDQSQVLMMALMNRASQPALCAFNQLLWIIHQLPLLLINVKSLFF